MLIGYISKRVWFILKLKVVQPITPRISWFRNSNQSQAFTIIKRVGKRKDLRN